MGAQEKYLGSLVPRPVRAIRVTWGGLEPSAIARGVLGEFSRQAWQVNRWNHIPNRRGRPGTRLGFGRPFADGLNRSLVSSAAQAVYLLIAAKIKLHEIYFTIIYWYTYFVFSSRQILSVGSSLYIVLALASFIKWGNSEILMVWLFCPSQIAKYSQNTVCAKIRKNE